MPLTVEAAKNYTGTKELPDGTLIVDLGIFTAGLPAKSKANPDLPPGIILPPHLDLRIENVLSLRNLPKFPGGWYFIGDLLVASEFVKITPKEDLTLPIKIHPLTVFYSHIQKIDGLPILFTPASNPVPGKLIATLTPKSHQTIVISPNRY